MKRRPISILSENLSGKTWTKLLTQDLSVQEVYYNLPYYGRAVGGVQLSHKEIITLIDLFNTPITRLSHIRPRWIENLRVNGIKSFINFAYPNIVIINWSI